VFYGWTVVGATHVALFVIFGVGYSFAAFFSAFEREFSASRGDVSLVFSIFGFLYFLIGAFTGMLADRFGPRPVCVAGMLLLATGLVATSQAPTLWLLYLTYSVGIGLGVGFVYVPSVGAVQPWFIRRRGLASGIAVAGIGTGTLLVPMLAAWLIGLVGWRQTYLVFAAGALLLGGGAALFIDNSPARRGLFPDNARGPIGGSVGTTPRQVPAGVTLREALGTRAFQFWFTSLFFTGIGLFVPFVHLVPYARDHGLSEQTGVFLMGLIGVGSLVGRFALGGIGDRMPRATLTALFYAGMASMLALWLVSTSELPLAVFALVFGTCYGGFVAVQPALAMDYFGARAVAGIIGVAYAAVGVGVGIGPWLAGVAYDLQRSYTLPITAAIVFMGIAAAFALLMARERPRVTH
jgi:MFS family permease